MLLFVAGSGQAAGYSGTVDNLRVRPDVGYGYAVSKDHRRGMGYHAGVRVLSEVRSLSTPTPTKAYGISIAEVSPFESKAAYRHEKYLALGIMLEQSLSDAVAVTIGTLGYIGIGRNKNNPFGLNTEFGWKPVLGREFRGFLAVRYETIYDTSTISRYALSFGITYMLF